MAVWLSLWQTRDHIEATLELLSMKRRIPTWMLGIVFLLGPGWPSECPWVPNRISKMLWESKLTKKTSTFVTLISEENETRNKNPANFFTLQNFLAGCQRHLLYAAQGIPRINNNASAPFPPAPPNLILQSRRFSLAKLFPGKGKIFRDNLELSILNWGVRGVTKQKKKIKATRFYLQSFFRPQ